MVQQFRALAPMYYRGSAAAIIVYDITKEETFSTLKNWVRELRQHGPPSIVVAIAGNKCDLTDVSLSMESRGSPGWGVMYYFMTTDSGDKQNTEVSEKESQPIGWWAEVSDLHEVWRRALVEEFRSPNPRQKRKPKPLYQQSFLFLRVPSLVKTQHKE
ncbi:ras-related protein Rab-22A-like protein [Cricetulus griseus]|uniref:Ras-related protein Rab-22A-like protein n=1 Tax=Cricetulus griseus TaxID=10029 RepID=A0A061I1W4_CRIGR|nr:ras-related protein Rab-22A-like protein [Cricetulus griseus]